MRRCGHNPTDIEVSDIINKIHDDTGSLDLEVGFINQEIAVNDIEYSSMLVFTVSFDCINALAESMNRAFNMQTLFMIINFPSFVYFP